MTSPANASRAGHFRAALRAEWTKFRTVRGWMAAALFAVVMVIAFTFLQANGKQSGYCTTPNPDSCVTGHLYVPTGPGGEAVADTYELVARRLSGDLTMTAQLTSFAGRIWAGSANQAPSLADARPGLTGWAKAGLLLTSDPTQGSPYAAVMLTGDHGARFQDDYTHDRMGLPGVTARWLRLTRTGDTVTGYDSTNGTSWHRIAAARLTNLPSHVFVGLFTTSPVTADGLATQATATFRAVTAGLRAGRDAQGVSGAWRALSVGAGATSFYTTLGNGGYRRGRRSITLTGSGDIAPAVANAGGDTAADSLLFGLVVAMTVLIVTGTMFITSEYRRGLIRTTFAATPDRGLVLAAKAVVVGLVGFAVGALAAAVAIPLGEHVLKSHGNYIFPSGPLTVAQVIVGSGALTALTAIAMLGVGVILRRSSVTILVGVAVFVLPTFTGPGVLGPTSGGAAATWLYRFSPAAGFSMLGLLPRSALVSYRYTMSNGYYPLPGWAGLLVLAAYAALALGVARFVCRRRDA